MTSIIVFFKWFPLRKGAKNYISEITDVKANLDWCTTKLRNASFFYDFCGSRISVTNSQTNADRYTDTQSNAGIEVYAYLILTEYTLHRNWKLIIIFNECWIISLICWHMILTNIFSNALQIFFVYYS